MDNNLRIQQLEDELSTAQARIEELENLNSATSVHTSKLSNHIDDLKESVIDNLHNPLLILDNELQIVFSNKKFQKTFHITARESEGKLIYDLPGEQWSIPQLRQVLETVLPSKASMSNFELEFPNAEEGTEHLTINASEIKLTGSNERYILLSIEDVTRRKFAQKSLKKREQQFHNLFYTSNAHIAVLSGPNHVIDMANDAIIQSWGKGPDVLGKPIIEVLPELEEQGFIDKMNAVYETGIPFRADEMPVKLMINGAEQQHFFDFSYQAQKNEEGEIVGIAAIANDVTKQGLLNDQIKKSELEFRGLVNMIPNKINLADAAGNTFFYNQSWLDFVGLAHDDFINRDWRNFVHPEDLYKMEREVERCLAFSTEFENEARMMDKNGEYKYHYIHSIPVKNDKGEITTWIGTSTEIQKLKEEEIKKEAFLKLVSHELKTPVTSIKGYVQLLQSMLPAEVDKGNSKVAVKPYLTRIENQIERLIRLISEMLDLSRIEQNELVLNLSEFNLNEHIKSVIEDLTYSVKDMQVKITNDDEALVIADKDRIGQVMINFITNALKYSPDSNKVNIRIFNDSEDTVAVTVQDFGIGIDKKEQYQIFKRFYRIAGNKDDTYDGFGIGLYLSNEIIEKHNGKIVVNSEPGAGSEFTFILPLNKA